MRRFPSPRVITALAAACAELLLVMMPILIVMMVYTYYNANAHDQTMNDHSVSMLDSPEWAFASSVLGCQTLLAFMTGVARQPGTSPQRLVLAIAGLLVLVVGPSFVVLGLTVLSELNHKPSDFLGALQLLLFLAAVVVFVLSRAATELIGSAERMRVTNASQEPEDHSAKVSRLRKRAR